MRVLLCLPPARVSHEVDLFRAMPDVELTILSDIDGWHADRTIITRAARLPYFGHRERWSGALAWHRGLAQTEAGPTDVVVSLELFSVITHQARRVAQRLQVPHIVWLAANRNDHPIYRLPPWRQLTRGNVPEVDGFLCISELSRRHAISKGCPEDRCKLVYPGIDIRRFSPAPSGRTREPILAYVGQLQPYKGLDEIVTACDGLVADGLPLRLMIVGDGPLRRKVDAWAATRSYMEVRGAVPRASVPDVLRESRALVLASTRTWWEFEQFGFSLVEAMATGLPVVTTQCGTIPEIVPGWNPIVTEHDPVSLAAGIRAALGPQGDVWGRCNREEVERRFDVEEQGRFLGTTLLAMLGAIGHDKVHRS